MTTPPPKKKVRKNPQEKPYSWFSWRFSQQNWPEGDPRCVHEIIEDLLDNAEAYAFQYEFGGKNKVLHIQGMHKLRSRCGTTRRKFTEAGFEDAYPLKTYCEGARNPGCLWEYCKKSETATVCPTCGAAGPWIKGAKPIVNRDLCAEDLSEFALENRPWSKKAFDMFAEEPPLIHNKVYWFWSKHSEAGKNTFLRHLKVRRGAIALDMFSPKHSLGIVFKNPAPIYYINIPRERHSYMPHGKSDEADRVYSPINYKFLETLSDMTFMAAFGDNTGMVCRRASWIIVTANEQPFGPFFNSGRIKEFEIDSKNDLIEY